MIRFAVVHRAKDGLALSASTDIDGGVELRESKRYAKLLSRKARQFPIKCWMAVGRFRIFFMTEADVCFLLISEANFQPILAFSFLEDLKKEFLSKYTRGAVDKAIRPYSFIEFDSYIQKTKQKYNNTRTLYTRIDLSEVGELLKNNPPYEVSEVDLGVNAPIRNGNTMGSTQATPLPTGKTKLPLLSTLNMVSLILSALCAILNLIRLVPFVSQHTDDTEEKSYWMSISLYFFLSMLVNLIQSYILLYPITARTFLNYTCLISNLLLVYLLEDLRNFVQIAFHVFSALLVTYSIWSRKNIGKLPNYNV